MYKLFKNNIKTAEHHLFCFKSNRFKRDITRGISFLLLYNFLKSIIIIIIIL